MWHETWAVDLHGLAQLAPQPWGLAVVTAPQVDRAIARNPTVEEIFDAHASFIFRTARYLGVGDADLDDVVQEVFLVVCRRLGELADRAALRTWLYAIALRVVANHRRTRRRRREDAWTDAPEQSTTDGPLDELERRRARAALLRALEQLDHEKREVFVLFELEELHMNEVAELVECPLKTAYSRLYAARKQVTDWLSQHAERSGS